MQYSEVDMTTVELHQLKQQILALSMEQKVFLMQDVLQDIVYKSAKPVGKDKPLEQTLQEFWATLPPDLPQYSDEEFDEMRLGWRMEKYD
jgi:hypothetical protein